MFYHATLGHLWLSSLLGDLDYSRWRSDYPLYLVLWSLQEKLCLDSVVTTITFADLGSILLFTASLFLPMSSPSQLHTRMKSHTFYSSRVSQWSIMLTRHIESPYAWASPSYSAASATARSSLYTQPSWLVTLSNTTCPSATVSAPSAYTSSLYPASPHQSSIWNPSASSSPTSPWQVPPPKRHSLISVETSHQV